MFSLTNHLRNARALTVAFLTLEDGEETRWEADWEGRRFEHWRRPSAPAVSSAARRETVHAVPAELVRARTGRAGHREHSGRTRTTTGRPKAARAYQ